jgi:hypothetical protein
VRRALLVALTIVGCASHAKPAAKPWAVHEPRAIDVPLMDDIAAGRASIDPYIDVKRGYVWIDDDGGAKQICGESLAKQITAKLAEGERKCMKDATQVLCWSGAISLYFEPNGPLFAVVDPSMENHAAGDQLAAVERARTTVCP